MQTQSQSRWFVSATAGLLIILTLLSGYFLLPERLARHMLERLSQESGVEILPVRVDYSLFSGELVLKDSDLYLIPGLQISADEVRLRIPLSQLRSSTLHIDSLRFQSPYINVDLERLGNADDVEPSLLQQYLTSSVDSFELGKGGLYISRTGYQPVATSLAYQSMQIMTDNSGELMITIDGLSEAGDWAFQGVLDLATSEVNGELDVRNMPLAEALRAFPGTHLERWQQATITASQGLNWSPTQGLQLEGTLELSDGVMSFSDKHKLRWKELELFGFSFVDNTVSVVRGMLSHADVLLTEKALTSLPEQLAVLSELELKQVNVFTQLSEWQKQEGDADLSGFNGQLVKNDEMALTLKGTAYGQSLLPVAIESSFDAQGRGQARINLRKLVLDKTSSQYRTVAGYDLSGSQLNAAMQLTWDQNDRKAKGRLTFTEFKARPENDSAIDWNLSLIQAAMTDNKGRIIISVPEQSLSDNDLSSALVDIMKESVHQGFKQTTESPYQYLTKLSGSEQPLIDELDYVPGRALLCGESENTVNQWVNILNRRPALDLSFQGQSSRETDWVSLAQVELEADLLELYSAISNKKPDDISKIPVETRLQLIEQMYLRIHNRKLPDIGEESQKQRAAKAESWLLKNWPVKSENLMELANQRAETLRGCMTAGGVANNRLNIEPARVVEGQVRMRFKLLY